MGKEPPARVQAEPATTEDKRAFLREWALGLAKGDPSALPVIREARKEIAARFGATLGTNIITRDLKALRQELERARLGDVGVVGSVPPAVHVTPNRIRQIVEIMRELGIKSITLDENDEIFELRRKGMV